MYALWEARNGRIVDEGAFSTVTLISLMEREDEAGLGEDGQVMIKEWSNRTVAECSRLARDRQQWRLLVHEVIDPQQ